MTGVLLERGVELALIDALIRDALTGVGGVALVEGSAGVGKTALLAAARERAASAGMRVLPAGGGELEGEVAFGVVRQLFEAFVLAVGWAFLGGVGLVVAAPPPSDAFPYQDLTHLLSILIGALAAIAFWRELKRSRTVWSPLSIAIAVLLLILLFATQGAASASSP